jgi:hypothetical protein
MRAIIENLLVLNGLTRMGRGFIRGFNAEVLFVHGLY